VIPRHAEDLPVVDWSARRVTYDRWWGQRKLDRDGKAAAYPFGFGLGYTAFQPRELEVGPLDGERFRATVTAANTGPRTGRHVVQIYGHLPGQQRPVRALLGFQGVEVAPGGTATVTVDCTTRPLQRWTAGTFELTADSVVLEAASYSGDPTALLGRLHLAAKRQDSPSAASAGQTS
jgi:beta-glucosidase